MLLFFAGKWFIFFQKNYAFFKRHDILYICNYFWKAIGRLEWIPVKKGYLLKYSYLITYIQLYIYWVTGAPYVAEQIFVDMEILQRF